MSKHKMTVDAECTSCGATGLYCGMAERNGAAVICHTCKGTGCQRITYEWTDFKVRKSRKGVRRVYLTNPGIVIGEGNGHELKDFGGMTFAEWKKGKPFPPESEDRAHTCPAWFWQAADYKRKPNWDECLESLGRSFSACPHFKAKAQCWKRFDREAP